MACSGHVSVVLPISCESLLTPSGRVDPMPCSVPTLSADARFPSLQQSGQHFPGSIVPRPADYNSMTSVLVISVHYSLLFVETT